MKYDFNAGEEDYPWIDLKMKGIWSLTYLNVDTEIFKLTILLHMDEDIVVGDQSVVIHNWIKKRIMFSFRTMIDVN